VGAHVKGGLQVHRTTFHWKDDLEKCKFFFENSYIKIPFHISCQQLNTTESVH